VTFVYPNRDHKEVEIASLVTVFLQMLRH
jgi:hypothetical protein